MKSNRVLRHLLANRVIRNGGYSSRNEHAALAWDVPYYGIGAMDILAYIDKCPSEFQNGADVMLRFPNVYDLFDRWTELRDEAPMLEQMREGVHDNEGYRMWSPGVARRYGFSYDGLGAEKPFPVGLEFRGRGGKHLCITGFCGFSLELPAEVLAEQLTVPGEASYWQHSNTWVRRLLGMIDEWDKCFTENAVQEEARYLTAWEFEQWLANRNEAAA